MKLRWAVGLFVFIASTAVAGDPGWKMASTANYQILSQVSDAATADWMRGFDQYILSISDFLKINLRALPPLTVVIFARDKDYTPYKLLRPNGTTANVAGQFVRRPTWSMIAMAHDAFDDHSRRTINHEGTHWLMSVDQSSQPAWFSEGIAEVFSTFERGVGKVNWGKPIEEHLTLLHEPGVTPLATLLTESSALFDDDDHTNRFYAESWAFTHYLVFSKDPAHRQLLSQFLQTFRTQSAENTVKAVFGPSLPNIERDFHIYIDQRSWSYAILPEKPAALPPALQPAPPALVEESLGYLALGAGHPDLARQHAEKAISLAPDGAAGHAILAYLAMDGSQYDLAATQADAALQRGSKDSDLFVLLGDSYAQGANSSKPDASRTRANLYELAINLTPWRVADYERLSDALLALEKPRVEDTAFLDKGLHVFPGDDWLRVGSAVVNERLGHHDEAVVALDTALRADSKLDPQQRDFAANVRGRWLMQSMNAELTDATDKRDFTAARAVLGRYRDRLGNSPQVTAYLQETDATLEANELLAKFDALKRDNNKAAARAVAEQLLALPNLSASMRQYVERRLGAKN